jgi:hypothetical protein
LGSLNFFMNNWVDYLVSYLLVLAISLVLIPFTIIQAFIIMLFTLPIVLMGVAGNITGMIVLGLIMFLVSIVMAIIINGPFSALTHVYWKIVYQKALAKQNTK